MDILQPYLGVKVLEKQKKKKLKSFLYKAYIWITKDDEFC